MYHELAVAYGVCLQRWNWDSWLGLEENDGVHISGFVQALTFCLLGGTAKVDKIDPFKGPLINTGRDEVSTEDVPKLPAVRFAFALVKLRGLCATSSISGAKQLNTLKVSTVYICLWQSSIAYFSPPPCCIVRSTCRPPAPRCTGARRNSARSHGRPLPRGQSPCRLCRHSRFDPVPSTEAPTSMLAEERVDALWT